MIARLLTLALASLLAAGVAGAADITGKWTAEFDSQIGRQKYTYEFKRVDGKLTGTAKYDHAMAKGEVALKEIKVDGEQISFVEVVGFGEQELVIRYQGKLVDGEMKLTRSVGEFAVEQIVAKRLPEPEAEAATPTSSP